MKNIHILPTTQKSRLATKDSNGKLEISDKNTFFVNGWGFTPQNIYITSAQEIKVGDWYYLPRTNSVHKCIEDPTELNLEIRLGVAKIIITTDQSLIVDGIQVIDDTFLEWFVNNPTYELVMVRAKPPVRAIVKGIGIKRFDNGYKIIIPKEEPSTKLHKGEVVDESYPKEFKQEILEENEFCHYSGLPSPTAYEDTEETLEEAAERLAIHFNIDFINGAEWQQERSYSEEEVKDIMAETWIRCVGNDGNDFKETRDKILEQFNK